MPPTETKNTLDIFDVIGLQRFYTVSILETCTGTEITPIPADFISILTHPHPLSLLSPSIPVNIYSISVPELTAGNRSNINSDAMKEISINGANASGFSKLLVADYSKTL